VAASVSEWIPVIFEINGAAFVQIRHPDFNRLSQHFELQLTLLFRTFQQFQARSKHLAGILKSTRGNFRLARNLRSAFSIQTEHANARVRKQIFGEKRIFGDSGPEADQTASNAVWSASVGLPEIERKVGFPPGQVGRHQNWAFAQMALV
jgi:hypothetical protein